MNEQSPKDTLFYVYRDDSEIWPSYIIVAADEGDAVRQLKIHLRRELQPNSRKLISLLAQCDLYKTVEVGKVDVENGNVFMM